MDWLKDAVAGVCLVAFLFSLLVLAHAATLLVGGN